jgi:hypothetical protein
MARTFLFRPPDGDVMMFKWLLVPASILATISLAVFVVADVERITLRSVAAGTLLLACLVMLGAGLFALYGRKRN